MKSIHVIITLFCILGNYFFHSTILIYWLAIPVLSQFEEEALELDFQESPFEEMEEENILTVPAPSPPPNIQPTHPPLQLNTSFVKNVQSKQETNSPTCGKVCIIIISSVAGGLFAVITLGICGTVLFAVFKRYQLRDRQFKQRFIDPIENEELLI